MDKRQKIASALSSHVICSAHYRQNVYIDLIVPPPDRVEPKLSYYIGGKPPSTCALAACGALRLAGMTDAEICGPYVIGRAIANLENVAARYGALRIGTPDRLLHTGDICVITRPGGDDPHVVCFVGEPVVAAVPDNYYCDTVEGGQLPDSSGVGNFSRLMMRRDSHLYCGERLVAAWIDADCLPIGDDASPETVDNVIGG